jgi:hypothetical protein
MVCHSGRVGYSPKESPTPELTDPTASPLDRATDRLLALENDLTVAASGIMPLDDDSDVQLLEALFGILRARDDIREAIGRVAAGRPGR